MNEAKKADYTWQIICANGFLVLVVTAIAYLMRFRQSILDGPTPLQTTMGFMVGSLLAPCVITCVLYLTSRSRGTFRFWRCLILTTWTFEALNFYPFAYKIADEGYHRIMATGTRSPVDSSAGGLSEDFSWAFYTSCYNGQRSDIKNKGVPDKLIADYCSCSSRSSWFVLTKEDLSVIEKLNGTGGPLPQTVQEKIDRASGSCMASAISRMPESDLRKMDRLSHGLEKSE